jgi:putative spermidine/putrescine transport system permease protein
LPLILPSLVAGLDLHVLADPRRLHHSEPAVEEPVHRQRDLRAAGRRRNLPLAAAFTFVPVLIMGVYLALARRLGAFEAL